MKKSMYRFGCAQRVITPPLGVPLAGYWHLRRAEGVLDDIYARCLVIACEDTLAAIISLDVINIPTTFCDLLLDRIVAETGLPRDAVLISATHTHTAPALMPLMNQAEESGEYRETLARAMPAMVREALSNLAPGVLGLAAASVDGLAFNRRLLGVDGRVVTYKPDTYAVGASPAGPVDAALRLACCLDADSQPLAVLANFGLHPDTTGGSLISADYPGVFCEQLQRRLGPSAQVIFLNAPCGDINHLNPHQAGTPYTPENARRIGTRLADRAAHMLENLSWQPARPIRFATQALSLKIRAPEPDALRIAREKVDSHAGLADKALSRARGLLQMSARAGETVSPEVCAISTGDWAIVGIPGEVFTQTGLDIRAESPFEHTWITGLTNGYCGYIPEQEAFAQGGYETLLGPGSYLETGASRLVADACSRLLNDLFSKNAQNGG